MTPEQFRELLVREPFHALRLHLNRGDVVEITDPGSVLILGATLQFFTVRREQAPIVDSVRYIYLRNVSQVEQLVTA